MIKKITLVLSTIFLSNSLCANEYSATIINDTSRVLSGGINKASASRTLGHISAEFTLNKNYTLYADALAYRGDNGTDDTGAIQAYSNLDEADFSKIFEAWLEGNYEDEGIRFKLGQVDANSEFAYTDHGGEFIHSSMGFSPSISFLPTYPAPTLSASIFWQLNESSNFSFGAFSDESNDFDEVFYIGEWAGKINDTQLKAGIWHQTGNLEKLNNNDVKNGVEGFYFTAEGSLSQQLFSSQSAGWFTQIGYSDDTISEIDFHFGAGISWYGTFNRENDVAGMGLSHAAISRYLHDEMKNSEMAFEVFYRFQLNDHVALKPDIQYIVDPATDKNISNALVVTLRTEISF